ncbi:class I SAM-dependent methyltransferase [Halobacterium salinarum]|uniref:Methyltransferase domain-containing protein n=5 Tax=Halobacterium salinarum TaxID=2242 RepID=A0A4D6GVG6_HALS9|nr:class I SAM-dependent methyltransferase [Halobacterium salinarum]AAG19035.1 conserved hypothetical protein [Halobacterium salinarum NRC-1]MBB6089870.1 SAM-dependent methyltransferase [Halobacterium salinarum]MDL0125912.1 class I SAM-dependent methyltransferase [Halobacterium salinarum]MDL0127523.1 class I SAM-dependent methyltransferase [Halobacterium salinarum]MDL0129665.1 class I SAM-dependent methyltransferase [Halobacterium salinarum]
MTDWQADDVVAAQYADGGLLAARRALDARFGTGERSHYEWLFDHLDLGPDAAVLSLGAGHGAFWGANADRVPDGWDVTVTDAFQGVTADAMDALADAPHEFTFDVVDARDIPYPADTFDAVTAHHVLAHLGDADRRQALAEIARVLTPTGELHAATSGDDALTELWAVARDHGDVPDERPFTLQNGAAQLRDRFAAVERRRLDAPLVVDAPEPLVAYVLSLPGFDPEAGPALERAFRARFVDGTLTVTGDRGVLIARHPDTA